MTIEDILPDESAIFELHAERVEDVLPELAAALARQTGLASERLLAGLLERERLGSTALGGGFAIPHTKAEVASSRGVLGLASRGFEFGAPDGRPTRVFLAFISPPRASEHLRALVCVSRAFKEPSTIDRVVDSRDPAAILALLRQQSSGSGS